MTDQQKRIYWNRNWQFLKGFEESYLGLQTIDAAQELEQVELPHTVQEVPLHYFDESLYQGIFTYRKVFRPKWCWVDRETCGLNRFQLSVMSNT